MIANLRGGRGWGRGLRAVIVDGRAATGAPRALDPDVAVAAALPAAGRPDVADALALVVAVEPDPAAALAVPPAIDPDEAGPHADGDHARRGRPLFALDDGNRRRVDDDGRARANHAAGGAGDHRCGQQQASECVFHCDPPWRS